MLSPSNVKNIVTKKDIVDKLTNIGLIKGDIVEVHASLSSFGYVVGGAQSVVDAIIEVIGNEGTILMAMNIPYNCEPSKWNNIPLNQIKYIRDNIPYFDKKSSDVGNNDEIVENLRRRENAMISYHPTYSFVAYGKYANLLCNRHSLHFPFSSESPLARMYELKAKCLLMGVDYTYATCMHLAEYATDCRPIIIEGASVLQTGNKIWKKYLNLELNYSDFIHCGHSLEKLNKVSMESINNCIMKLFFVNDAVDEATRYFENFSSYNFYR